LKINRPLIVASLAVTSKEKLRKIHSINSDLIELRLDYLENPFDVPLHWIKDLRNKVIVTVRNKEEGGINEIDEDKKRDFLKKLYRLGIRYDVEAKFLEKHDIQYENQIVSAHFLSRLPSKKELREIISKYYRNAFAVKLAIKAKGNYRELLIYALNFKNIAVMPIDGDPIERIAFALLGSKLVYGFVSIPTAEGQLSYKELIRIFNYF